ncbi:hypothetical protein E3N88_09580 [Mikania micrantha]|uniref:Uncharacterized protein n=1 Tax=Mikania micrantha TaxID=192012 RepID=A0A5N6PJI2_9ASTR|nr:hypothetical protein E3N88_09580 [Mikania micrantha]
MYLTIVYVIAERLGHVIARLLDIPELLSAYMRYVKAKHESIDSKLLPGYKGHVIARLLDIPELVSAYMRHENFETDIKGLMRIELFGGVNEVKVLLKEVKDRFKLKLLDMHTRLPR